MSIIEIRSLCKDYKVNKEIFTALNNVNLTVEKNDIYGIIGLSGAGKSTLIRCINLLEKPSHGSITFMGEVIYENIGKGEFIHRDLNLFRRKMGMIFQNFNLFEQRSVLKNVLYPLELAHVNKEEALNKALKLLEIVGLADKVNSYPSQLSGGQKQRVAIARALANDPEVLLCDEPTSALDPTTTVQILDLLKEINEKLGVTIIIITHEMKIIDKICNKVSIIDKSEIVESGYVKDVFLNPKSSIAKKLVLPLESFKINPSLDKKYLRVVFDGTVDEPIISNLILHCNCELSILSSNIRMYDEKAYGQMIIQVPSEEVIYKKIIEYLVNKEIKVEEVDENGLESDTRCN